MKHNFWSASLLGLMMTLSLGCPPRDVEPDDPAVDPEVDSATIEGRLEAEIGSIANATIFVYRVEANGALQNLTIGSPRSDAQGAFSVAFNTQGGPFADLLVEAIPNGVAMEQDGEAMEPGQALIDRARLLVVREIATADTVTVAPLNFETTVEADVYVQARTAGEWDDRCDTPSLRLMITPALAAAVVASENYAGDIEVLARSTTAGMKAYMSSLLAERERLRLIEERDDDMREGAEPVTTFDDDDLQSARTNLRSAFNDFDERMFQTTGIQERMEARNELYENYMTGYTDNNINLHLQARAVQAAAQARGVYFTNLTDAAQPRAMADNEFFRAMFVTRVIEENADRLGVSGEPRAAIEQAGNSLHQALLGLAEAAVDIDQAIMELWVSYQTTVENQLQIELDANQVAAYNDYRQSVFADRGQFLDAVDGLQPTMSSSAVANTAVENVPGFHHQIVTEQRIANLEELGFDDEGAHAILENLFHFAIVTGHGEAE